jgi:hypothetical protein
MPRYHFHIFNGVKIFDSKGMALPDDLAAQLHARIAARNFNRNLTGQKIKVRVTNEKGQTLYEVQPEEEI